MSNPWEIADSAQRMLREAQEARGQVAQLLAQVERRSADLAGVALWCSVGEHSFGQQDRKRAMFTLETMDEETGAPITEKHLMCGPCAAKRRGAFQPSKALPATPVKGTRVVDDEEYARYMAYLEQQAGEDNA
jgi:hypothetical protein